MTSQQSSWRDSFWASPPELPGGLTLARRSSAIAVRPGQRGESVFDWVELGTPGQIVTLLVAAKPELLARDVVSLKGRLQGVIDDQARRQLAVGAPVRPAWPAIATDVATPSVVDACEREGVALLDRRGTLIVRTGPVFVHVAGKGKLVRRPNASPFAGKAARIVRFLLQSPGQAHHARSVASATQTSYVYAHNVLTALEAQGFVGRASPRSGFTLSEPGGLLRAWIDARRPTAVSVEKFNAPSTTWEVLAEAQAELRRTGTRGIFTLASALRAEERHAAQLPHGIYLSGAAEPIHETLKLRRVTPYNFWILRPEGAADTERGGIYFAARHLPHGEGVALPQLAVDFANAEGRGPEQATRLIEAYLATVPFIGREDDRR